MKNQKPIKRQSNLAMGLRTAYLSMHRQIKAHLAVHGVTADQFVCLYILDEQDGITQKQLADRAGSDPNTIRAMLVLLEKRGLIARQKHPADGRARFVTITPKGRWIFEQLVTAVKPVRERMLEPFSEGEVETLYRSLDRISNAMIK